jgi:enoyl-CoA hydratase/carnithine racemase
MEPTMSCQEIRIDIDNGVATLSLHRPERMNAFTVTMAHELANAFASLDANDEVRAIIFTGSGKAFCAGADLSQGGDAFNYDETKAGDDIQRMRDTGGMVTLAMYECRKPIIAAINGAAVGIGATMCLAADIRLASERARFGFVFARRGIVPEAASAWFLPRIVGMSQAMEWMLSGRVFDAREALEGRLVKSLHTDEDLLPAAMAIARDIADNTSAVSVALIRQMLWRLSAADHPVEAHKIDSRGVYFTGKSADAREGVQSFLEKRPARFSDKVSTQMPPFYPWWQERHFE